MSMKGCWGGFLIYPEKAVVDAKGQCFERNIEVMDQSLVCS